MLIKTLEVIHYPASGSTASGEPWESLVYPDPTWGEIEKALARLDRDVYPFLWLHVSEFIEDDPPEHAMDVMGGLGEYAISIELPGRGLTYSDESRGATVVDIWVSDQGSQAEERDLCNDYDLLLKIVRHFAETGEAYPEVNWAK